MEFNKILTFSIIFFYFYVSYQLFFKIFNFIILNSK